MLQANICFTCVDLILNTVLFVLHELLDTMSDESCKMSEKVEESVLSGNCIGEVKQLSKNQLKKLKRKEKWLQIKEQKRFVLFHPT